MNLLARLVAAIAAALGVAALMAGCGTRTEQRLLPAERQAPLLYVALGDSTVEGIGATGRESTFVVRLHERLREIYPNAGLRNLGTAGATSADVRERQLPAALAQRPQLVTLSVGPNDVTGHVAVGRFEENADGILSALLRDTGAVVIVTLLPDLAVTPRFRGSPARDAVGRMAREYNEALQRVASRYDVQLVDLFTASREEIPRRPELVARDGYHPSDAGYARWADLMWPAVAARLPRGVRA
jgi:acyl-CoA thioesterase I